MTGQPLIWAFLWVIAGTFTALMPLRRQYLPALTLLLLAPVLLTWIAMVHGVLATCLATLAVISMFRHPLRYLLGRAIGRPVQKPGPP